MSRYNRYIRSIFTAYGLIGTNIVYSFVSIPLALGHLGKEVFGLWGLTIQIAAIIQLADVGMTGALNRILMSYKDDRGSKEYKQTFFTMWLCFSALGLAITTALYLVCPALVSLLDIPPNLRDIYTTFLRCYGVIIGFGFSMKVFPILPFVHQRSDLMNVISAVFLLISLGAMYVLLENGWGLWSLLVSTAIAQIGSNLAIAILCCKYDFYPRRSNIPKLSKSSFDHVFQLGRDRLLLTAGYTILQAAPTFLITRILGLEANAIWTVASRVNQLLAQLISKIPDLSYPVLTEMHVRGEQDRMKSRFGDLVMLGMGIAGVGAIGVATCNRDFLKLWTDGSITTTPLLDGMLALWLWTFVLQKFLAVPAHVAINLKDIRSSYLKEAIVVVLSSMLLLQKDFGLWPMAAILAVATILVTTPINLNKSAHILGAPIPIILKPIKITLLALCFPLLATSALSIALPTTSTWLSLIIKALAISAVSISALMCTTSFRSIFCEFVLRIVPARYSFGK